MHDIHRFEESAAYSSAEKAALRYAVALSRTPANVDQLLFDELKRHFSEKQLVELTSAIAWENYRARFNRGFDIGPDGFSEGAFCPMPERPANSGHR